MSSSPMTSRSSFTMPEVFPSVIHMLVRAAQTNPDGEALVVGPVRMRYRELIASIASLARELRARGSAGDRIAISLPNRADTVIALLGTMASEAQAVLVNPSYSTREFEHILSDSDCLLLICDEARRRASEEAITRLTRTKPLILGETDGVLVRRDTDDTLPDLLPDSDQLAVLLYTGGTTGRAKGVNLSHRTLSLNISQRCALLPGRPNTERFLGMTPLFHAYATHMVLYPALYSAGTMVFVPRYQPDQVLDLVAAEKITLFAGAPTIYNGLTKHPRFASTDFGSLVGAYSGAAPLSIETLNAWENTTGVPIAEGYGLTEATGMLCFNPLFGLRKAGSVGLPLPGTEVQIVDPDNGITVLPAGSLGEIRARGPQLMVGYRNQPEETANMIRNGWLYTGDVGELDTDGYLYIRDRKKDMAIVSGYNVYPREIDEVLFSHPAVLEAVSAGLPDSYRGETIGACVSLKPGSVADVAALHAHCMENLVAYKVPSVICIVPEVPKTGAGKIDRKAARVLLEQMQCAPSDASSASSDGKT